MNVIRTWFIKLFPEGSPARKVVGVLLIIIGFIALVTPFSPGSWLIFVGLGFFGVRLAFWKRWQVQWWERYVTWKKRQHTDSNSRE